MSIKGFFLKCILWGASKKEAVSTLNNVALEDRGVLGTHFGTIKTFIELIGEDAFGGTSFRNVYSGVNEKCCKKSWKEFNQMKGFDQKRYSSSYFDVSVNKYSVKCGTLLRFWENKG